MSEGDDPRRNRVPEIADSDVDLVRASVGIAVFLEVIPFEADIHVYLAQSSGMPYSILLMFAVKAVCLTLIFAPLAIYVHRNGFRAEIRPGPCRSCRPHCCTSHWRFRLDAVVVTPVRWGHLIILTIRLSTCEPDATSATSSRNELLIITRPEPDGGRAAVAGQTSRFRAAYKTTDVMHY